MHRDKKHPKADQGVFHSLDQIPGGKKCVSVALVSRSVWIHLVLVAGPNCVSLALLRVCFFGWPFSTTLTSGRVSASNGISLVNPCSQDSSIPAQDIHTRESPEDQRGRK